MNTIRTTAMLSSILLIFAILDMPPEYYRFVKIAIPIACILVIYALCKTPSEQQCHSLVILGFGALGILFNPISPFRLDMQTWLSLDIIGAVFFGVYYCYPKYPRSIPCGVAQLIACIGFMIAIIGVVIWIKAPTSMLRPSDASPFFTTGVFLFIIGLFLNVFQIRFGKKPSEPVE